MDISTIIVAAVVTVVVVLLIGAYLYRANAGDLKLDIGGARPRASGGSDKSVERSFRARLAGLGVVSGGVIATLLGKLWSMQLVSSEEYARLAERNRTRTISTEAPRGRILDRNGLELVTNRASLAVTAKRDVADDDFEVKLLSNVLGMPKVAVRRKIQDNSEGAQSAHTIALDVSDSTIAYINEHSYIFPDVSVDERTQRSYPQGDLACQVLGYTGAVTQELIEESEAAAEQDRITYELGDIVGQAGIEYQYENVLQGIRGEQTVFVDASGGVTDTSTTIDAQIGSDVVLTIDAKIQKGVEEGLAHAIEMGKRKSTERCKCGACVVLDVTNGEVLAMASLPKFSPSVFNGGISNDDWEQISSEDAGNPLLNRVVAGQYMSASTIKPLSEFAALNYDIVGLDAGFNCTGYWTGFGEQYGQYCWNHSGHGYMNLQNGLTYSCDVVFYEIGKGFFNSNEQDGLQKTFRRWGLGSKTGIDLPSESAGRVPDAEWKWNYFSNLADEQRRWQGGDITNLVIGQGDLLVTPLQMACVYMGIANGGTIWRPHVMKSIQTQSGTGSVVGYRPEPVVETSEEPTYLELIKNGLYGVIYQEDEAMTSHFSNLSVTVHGKTGTGEVQGKDKKPTSWFCAYAPAEDPKYVVAAVVEEGGFGTDSAMYAVRDALGAIYDEPDSSTQESATGAR